MNLYQVIYIFEEFYSCDSQQLRYEADSEINSKAKTYKIDVAERGGSKGIREVRVINYGF